VSSHDRDVLHIITVRHASTLEILRAKMFLECLRLRSDNSPSVKSPGAIDKGHFCVRETPRVNQSYPCTVLVRSTMVHAFVILAQEPCFVQVAKPSQDGRVETRQKIQLGRRVKHAIEVEIVILDSDGLRPSSTGSEVFM